MLASPSGSTAAFRLPGEVETGSEAVGASVVGTVEGAIFFRGCRQAKGVDDGAGVVEVEEEQDDDKEAEVDEEDEEEPVDRGGAPMVEGADPKPMVVDPNEPRHGNTGWGSGKPSPFINSTIYHTNTW